VQIHPQARTTVTARADIPRPTKPPLSWRSAMASATRPSGCTRSGTALAPPSRLAGPQLEMAQLLEMQCWMNPRIVFAAGEQMPDNNGDLAGAIDGSDMRLALVAHALVKRP